MGGASLNRMVGTAFYGRFNALHPAQEKAVLPILSGQDVVILAGTGSGKTEAMAAPVVGRLLQDLTHASLPLVLFIAPTRALVTDIHRRIEGPLTKLGIRSGVRHGEKNDLRLVDKPAFLVTTPESLEVLLSRQPDFFAHIQVVIIDEVHELYNTQRGLQLGIQIHRLERGLGRKLQVIAASATVADAHHLWQFFRPGHSPEVVTDPRSREIRARIQQGCDPNGLAAKIESVLVQQPTKIIVFTNSRAECDRLADALKRTSIGHQAFAHHSSLSKSERERVEQAFLQQRGAVCVATNTLQLGIDIGDIDLVILWGPPSGWQSFVQRIGRANRRESCVNVYCVVPDGRVEDITSQLAFQAVLHQVRSGRLEAPAPLRLYGAAIQQILSVTTHRAANTTKYTPTVELVEMLLPWAHLSADVVELLIDQLVTDDFLQRHPVKRSVGPTQAAYDLLDEGDLWGNFPVSSKELPVQLGAVELGRLPRDVAATLGAGCVFTFAGRRLEVMATTRDAVRVSSTKREPTTTIKFGGTAPTLDPSLMEAMWQALAADAWRNDVIPGWTPTPELAGVASAARKDALPYSATQRVAYTFAGRELNTLISAWTSSYGGQDEITVRIDADRLVGLPSGMQEFHGWVDRVVPDARALTRFQQILPPALLRDETRSPWESQHVWIRQLNRLRDAEVHNVA